MIRVKDIKISIDSKEHDIKKATARKLNIHPDEILDVNVYKKSVDARNKDIINCKEIKILNYIITNII